MLDTLIPRFLRALGRELITSEVTDIRVKGPLDVVSALDLVAERRIAAFLAEHFPGDSLLSEESASSVAYAPRIWVLDPLDGTVNLTLGIPFFALSLALLEGGAPVAAYVYDPSRDELFSAQRGKGAHLNGKRLQVASDGVCTLALTSGVVRALAARTPERLVTLLSRHGKLRGLGAQTLHLAYVAAGRLGAAVSTETKLWDNAAGALLVTEAGGIYRDLQWREPFPLLPDDPALRGAVNPCIAAAPQVFEAIAPLLEGLVD